MKKTKLLNPKQAACIVGVSRGTFELMTARNQVPEPITIGKRRFWNLDILKAWVKSGFKNKDGK